MTRRTINAGLGMCTYTDVNGVTRIGVAGEEVDVHPADVARFNKVNGIITYEAPAKKSYFLRPRAATSCRTCVERHGQKNFLSVENS